MKKEPTHDEIQAAQKVRWAKLAADSTERKAIILSDYNTFPALPLPPQAAPANELSLLKRDIKAYGVGFKKSAGQMYGYAYLAGRKIARAKELLPHGELQDWIEKNVPAVKYRMAHNWVLFAELLQPALAKYLEEHPINSTGRKSESIALLDAPAAKLSKGDESIFLNVVPTVMDGKSIRSFMRDADLAREPEKAGGYRPNPEAVQEFLEAKHPKLKGKTYEELEPAIQDEFRAWWDNRVADPANEIILRNQVYMTAVRTLAKLTDDGGHLQLTAELAEEADKILLDVRKALGPLTAKKD